MHMKRVSADSRSNLGVCGAIVTRGCVYLRWSLRLRHAMTGFGALVSRKCERVAIVSGFAHPRFSRRGCSCTASYVLNGWNGMVAEPSPSQRTQGLPFRYMCSGPHAMIPSCESVSVVQSAVRSQRSVKTPKPVTIKKPGQVGGVSVSLYPYRHSGDHTAKLSTSVQHQKMKTEGLARNEKGGRKHSHILSCLCASDGPATLVQ